MTSTKTTTSKIAPPPSAPSSLADLVSPGVVTPADLKKILTHAREIGYAIAVYRVTSSRSCNAVLGVARQSQGAPIILRTSYATSVNYAGKSIATDENENPNPRVAVSGAIALALHVRTMAAHYGVPVILQSETHCLHQLVTWYEGLCAVNEAYFAVHQEPMFTSHLLDLTMDNTVADDEEILAIAVKYLERLDRLKIWLDVPLRGETIPFDDGYSKETQNPPALLGGTNDDKAMTILPRKLMSAYKSLSKISKGFSLHVNPTTRNTQSTEDRSPMVGAQ